MRFVDVKKSEIRYQELDALRGIAALMVVLFHFTMGREEGKIFFNIGNTGVDLFFIISGFVISLTLNNVSGASQFVINRISRLYPTYWACVTLTFLIAASYQFYKGYDVNWVDYFANMSMFQYYFGVPDIDKSYWTMYVEMQFYVFVLLLFVFNILKNVRIIGITICVVTIVIVNFFWNDGFALIFQHARLLVYFPLFFSGIIFYKIVSGESKKSQDYLILLLCLVTQILLSDFGSRAKDFVSHSEYVIMLFIYFAVFALFVNNHFKFIKIKPLLFLGKISFALYLTHQYISLRHIIPFLTNTLKINFWIASMLISLPVCIVIATFITYRIDVLYSNKFRAFLMQLFMIDRKSSNKT